MTIGIALGSAVARAAPAGTALPSVVARAYDGAALAGEARAPRMGFMDPRRAWPWHAADAELVAELLRRLTGSEGGVAAIAVPAGLDVAGRSMLAEAARVAGLDVREIVDEPVAIARFAGADEALVVDVGATSLDVSAVSAGAVAETTTALTGGRDWDAAIVEWLVADLRVHQLRDVIAEGVDIARDRLAQRRLHAAAERAKIELSTNERTTIDLPFITANMEGPKHIATELTRAKLDELTAALVSAVGDSVGAVSAPGRVLLAGGMARVPAVQREVGRVTGREPEIVPDDAAARGAAG